ncbi:protein of unknown function [Candidatus Nitrotoga arctica]|uniref:Transposase n=1 Tax=Candidatus Nitrotoga arctica TaxID=453162 RepID=A0ABM8YY71_9PROT|nr:protein of unknown function [Candidatus Nitrotoga arctica]
MHQFTACHSKAKGLITLRRPNLKVGKNHLRHVAIVNHTEARFEVELRYEACTEPFNNAPRGLV